MKEVLLYAIVLSLVPIVMLMVFSGTMFGIFIIVPLIMLLLSK